LHTTDCALDLVLAMVVADLLKEKKREKMPGLYMQIRHFFYSVNYALRVNERNFLPFFCICTGFKIILITNENRQWYI
jgi:hypothetical protein